ncbi:hypothetical protein [Nocardioides maradonensis]
MKKLAALLGGMRKHSQFALHQGLQAHETPGIGATLIIQINSDPAKPAEVFYTTVIGSPSIAVGGN